MKILSLQTSSIFEQYGGIEYYLDDTLTSFASVCGPENVHALIPQRQPWKAISSRYQIHAVKIPAQGWRRKIVNRFPIRLFWRALRLVKQLDFNLILCGHVSLGPVVYALAKLTGKPFALIVYGIECWGNLFPQDEWCLKRADRIISISEWTKRILVQQGYPAQKIVVIHPIVANDIVNKRRLKDPSTPFTLLTISRLESSERYKGHDDVLEVLARINARKQPVRYLIQGDGNDKPRLTAKVAELGLQPHVRFFDATSSRSELLSLYAQADVFIMPSRFGYRDGRWKGEGFGIVYAEAGALGIPSIAYRCGGATDIIEHGKTGFLVTPDNLAELEHAIQFCLDNPEAVKAMGEKARQRVHALFTAETMKDRVSEFLLSFDAIITNPVVPLPNESR